MNDETNEGQNDPILEAMKKIATQAEQISELQNDLINLTQYINVNLEGVIQRTNILEARINEWDLEMRTRVNKMKETFNAFTNDPVNVDIAQVIMERRQADSKPRNPFFAMFRRG